MKEFFRYLALGMMVAGLFQIPGSVFSLDLQSVLEKHDPAQDSGIAPPAVSNSAGANAETDENTYPQSGTVKVSTTLNIRQGPWGKIIGHFRNSDKVEIVGRQGDWLKITWNGKPAFIHSKYVTIKGANSGTTTAGNSGSTGGTDTGNTGTNTGTTTTGPVAGNHANLDPDGRVPRRLLNAALAYFDANRSSIRNQRVISVIDFSKHSSTERFFIIDMQSGRVSSYVTAHGQGSDPNSSGYATRFSNTDGTHMSSVGIYVTGDTYQGGKGYSLYLDGKSGTNSNARSRAIVIHPASYVRTGGSVGRSWGCPALDPRLSASVIDRIKGGSVIYADR